MSDEPQAAAEILAHFQAAADSDHEDLALVSLARAFAGVVRGCEYAQQGNDIGQISATTRYDLVQALFRAEDAARPAFPIAFFEERVRHGVISIFCLLNAWAEPAGSEARRAAIHPGTDLVARIVSNDLDTLCAGLEMERRGLFPLVTSPVLSARAAKH